MDVVLRQSVVVFVDVGADAVQERRMQRVEALAAAEHACVALARERAQRSDRDVERGLDAPAERAAEIIDDRALRLDAHVAWNAIEGAADDIRRQRLGDAGVRRLGQAFPLYRTYSRGTAAYAAECRSIRKSHAVDRRQRAAELMPMIALVFAEPEVSCGAAERECSAVGIDVEPVPV